MTVEDPNESFRLLRDLVDYRNCVRMGLMKPAAASESPSSEALAAARAALRLTEEQLTRCHEMQQYQMVKSAPAVAGDADAHVKPWRLLVKRRLLKLHKEELDALLSVQAKEAKDAAKEAEKGGASEGASAAGAAGGGGDAPSREDLVAMRKARLEELFQELVQEYDEVLARAGGGVKAAAK